MGGLWLADYVGAFLTGGGTGPFFFHYMPAPLEASCNNSWGTFGMLKVDRDYHVQAYFAQYFAAQVVTREWVQPVDAVRRVFPVSSDVRDASGNLLVTAYAVERPDGKWSLLLINKDRENEHTVKIIFADPKEERNRFFPARWIGSPLELTNASGTPTVRMAKRVPTDLRQNPRSPAARKRSTSFPRRRSRCAARSRANNSVLVLILAYVLTGVPKCYNSVQV